MRKRDAVVLRNGAAVVFTSVAVAVMVLFWNRPAVEFAKGGEVVLANGADAEMVMLGKADQPVGLDEALVEKLSDEDRVVLGYLPTLVLLPFRGLASVELRGAGLVAFENGAPAGLGISILADAVVTRRRLLPLLLPPDRVLDEGLLSAMRPETVDDIDVGRRDVDSLVVVELGNRADCVAFLHAVELAYLVWTDVDVVNAVTRTVEVVTGALAVTTAGVTPRQEHAETKEDGDPHSEA